MIRYEQLEAAVEEWRARFSAARPFPHLVVDELFDGDVVVAAAREFPAPADMAERPNRKGVLELTDRRLVPPPLRQLSGELLGPRFTAWLSKVTGVDGLITDADGSWGALRQSGDGVEGKIHVPPARHPTKPWERRLTLILHLAPGLSESNGGCFQLWDDDGDQAAPRASIAPLFNRAVVFLNSPTAFHSVSRTHLDPGETRKTMQALYFTESPGSEGR